ncbi:cell division protein ZapA [Balneolales bacterium ANBcel1]|nr:cell division protein ZapA [Balneolales bacterium ANBcel1]
MKSIKVSILGKTYPLKINEGDEEAMLNIASYVDKRFYDFRKALINQPESTIMVLASLSIAEELFLKNNGNRPDITPDAPKIFGEINESLREILDDIEQENRDI